MFFLHVLLFYLLVPSVHSDEGVHWKQVLKNVAFKNKKNKWYWLPPQIYQGKPKEEMVCLDNVIGMDSNGEIMLYNLLDSPGQINSVGVVIEPATLLQRLDGIWRLRPDSSNYDHQDRLKVLIITSRNKLNPIWVSQLKRYLNSEEISIPQSPLLHDGPQSRPQTPESPISPTSSESDIAGHISDTHLKYMQRLVGFWYRVKGVNGLYPNDVVHFKSVSDIKDPTFYELAGDRPGDLELKEVHVASDKERRLIGLWFWMPRASTDSKDRRHELEFFMEDGNLVFDLIPNPRYIVNREGPTLSV